MNLVTVIADRVVNTLGIEPDSHMLSYKKASNAPLAAL